jgi:hypothetical protein
LAGKDIYAPITPAEVTALGVREMAHTGMRRNVHPPLAALLFAPLTPLSFPLAALVWTVASVVLLVVVLVWLGREPGLPLGGPWFCVALPLLPLRHPVWYHLHVGQFTIVLFALLVGAWRLAARGRPALAGCLVGVYLLRVAPANAAEWMPNARNDSLAGLSMRLFVGSALVRPFVRAPAAELPVRIVLHALVFSPRSRRSGCGAVGAAPTGRPTTDFASPPWSSCRP